MFDIGASLREARTRRGLSLDDVTSGLRIRERYVTALEEERWELLPGEAYAKSFLRMYAEFLGLDGQPLRRRVQRARRRARRGSARPGPARSQKGQETVLLTRTIVGVMTVAALVGGTERLRLGRQTEPARPARSEQRCKRRSAEENRSATHTGRAARRTVEAAGRAHPRGHVTLLALGPPGQPERQGDLPRLPRPRPQPLLRPRPERLAADRPAPGTRDSHRPEPRPRTAGQHAREPPADARRRAREG